ALDPRCAEAHFWYGLCLARQGELRAAVAALRRAHEHAGRQFIDPAFYLGLLLHRLGEPQEALRYLAEANRIDTGCALVACLTGICLVAAGGDAGVAARTLQRSLGRRGLAQWRQVPQRAWLEAFPRDKSWIHKLAGCGKYVCPVLGKDLTSIERQARLALGQAHYRLGAFQDAVDNFEGLFKESPPTAELLDWLGRSLARL